MKPNGIEWIGDIPDDWKVIRGKYTLDLLTRSTRDNDEVITCFRDGQVTLRSNRREDGFTFADKEIGYQGIRKGDLVIHGMDGFAGAIGISDSDGKGSPVLNVCRVKNKSDIRYINYYLRSLAWQNVFLAMTTGIRERSCDLRWKKIAELYFIVPPHQTQQKIADYLDEKCDEIDKTIEKQKESIEKLKTYKQSLISETVTKGLNKSTPLKPTGIDFLGDIPSHWEVKRVKYVANSFEKGNGITKDDVIFDGDIQCVRYGEIYSKYDRQCIESVSDTNIDKIKSPVHISKGDILFAGTGELIEEIGKNIVYMGDKPCLAGGDIIILKHNQNPIFLNYALNSTSSQSQKSYGKLKLKVVHISASAIGNIRIALPPITEQNNIAEFLDRKCEEIDSTINKKQNLIEKLDAYKKSLIFECVTGKRTIF